MTEYEQALFRNKNYRKLNDIYSRKSIKLKSDFHNQELIRYIYCNHSPFPGFKKLYDEFQENEKWSEESTYPILLYNFSLLYFKIRKFELSIKLIYELWENEDKIRGNKNKRVIIMMSVLTLELSMIFYGKISLELTEKCLNILSAYEKQNVACCPEILDCISNIRARINSCRVIGDTSKTPEQKSTELEDIVQGIYQTDKLVGSITGKKIILPVYSALSLTWMVSFDLSKHGFHFCIDKTRYISILSNCSDPNNFAILNNKGIYELYNARYLSASLHFTKALHILEYKHNRSMRKKIIYNLALSHLMKKKSHKAFKYFYSLTDSFSTSPYIWLRLAECVIMYYKQRVNKLRKRLQYCDIIAELYRTENMNVYILPLTDLKLFNMYIKDTKDLNLSFGVRCAKNALNLIHKDMDAYSEIYSQTISVLAYLYLELGDGHSASELKLNEIKNDFLYKIYNAHCKVLSIKRVKLEIVFTKGEKEEEINAYTIAKAFLSYKLKGQEAFQQNLPNDAKSPSITLTNICFHIKCRRKASAIDILKKYIN